MENFFNAIHFIWICSTCVRSFSYLFFSFILSFFSLSFVWCYCCSMKWRKFFDSFHFKAKLRSAFYPSFVESFTLTERERQCKTNFKCDCRSFIFIHKCRFIRAFKFIFAIFSFHWHTQFRVIPIPVPYNLIGEKYLGPQNSKNGRQILKTSFFLPYVSYTKWMVLFRVG